MTSSSSNYPHLLSKITKPALQQTKSVQSNKIPNAQSQKIPPSGSLKDQPTHSQQIPSNIASKTFPVPALQKIPAPAALQGNSMRPTPSSVAATSAIAQARQVVQENQDEEFEDVIEEVNSFEDYRPLKLKIGKSHPDPLVQSSSLAAVEPPDITYEINLPSHVQ
jgi:hypothetical protein